MDIPFPRGVDEPTYDPSCTPCVLSLDHDHPDGLRPMWPCLHCHNSKHRFCDPLQFCNCDCGLKGELHVE